MGLIEILIGVVFVLAFGTGVGVTTSANTAAEFMFARACYVVAAIALVAAYLWWLHEADRTPFPRVAVGILAALISLVGVPEAIRWVGARAAAFNANQNQVVFPKEPLPEVSHEQYEQLKEVAAFVSGDEQRLNTEFDYGNMIHFNILLWRKTLFPETNADELNKLIPRLGGPYTFHKNYMAVTQGRGGTVFVGKQDALYY